MAFKMRTTVSCVFVLALASVAHAQVLTPRSSAPAPASSSVATPAALTIPVIVPAGAILKVALDKEVHIRKVGQVVHGKLVEPVYAFDQLLIPAGSGVSGKIALIQSITRRTRVLSALNADLAPYRKVSVQFDSVRLADGRTVRLSAAPSAGSSGTLQFVTAGQQNTGAVVTGKSEVRKKVDEVRVQAKQEWGRAIQQLHEPGKLHRAERFALAELPYRPQYLDAGTAFDLELTHPLKFGDETIAASRLTSIGTLPPSGSVVHAVLTTPLSSATAEKRYPVEAIVTQPVIVDGQLYVPEGSRLIGTVLQAKPARRLGRNGQLRIAFHQLVPPEGSAQQIETTLEGLAVADGSHLKLDSESGARVTTPRTRYLSTALALVLATSSAAGDHEDRLQGGGRDAGPSAASGASGFKVIGMVLGAVAHSRALSTGMGVYGAAMSVYSHFVARGRDVVYPKGMEMVLALGTHDEPGSRSQVRR